MRGKASRDEAAARAAASSGVRHGSGSASLHAAPALASGAAPESVARGRVNGTLIQGQTAPTRTTAREMEGRAPAGDPTLKNAHGTSRQTTDPVVIPLEDGTTPIAGTATRNVGIGPEGAAAGETLEIVRPIMNGVETATLVSSWPVGGLSRANGLTFDITGLAPGTAVTLRVTGGGLPEAVLSAPLTLAEPVEPTPTFAPDGDV